MRNRVNEGGHNVPDDVIRRRFEAGLRNFHQVYKLVVDNWSLLDNSDNLAILLEEGNNR